jgi:hypothetical protein
MSCTVLKEKMKQPKGLMEDLGDMASSSLQWMGQSMFVINREPKKAMGKPTGKKSGKR